MIVEIPMTPSTVLSPNARAHWAPKAKAAAELRDAARLAVLSSTTAAERSHIIAGSGIGYTVTVYWKRGGSRDEDNILARCKAAIDGIADGLGIDDKRMHVRGVNSNTSAKLGVTVFTLIRED